MSSLRIISLLPSATETLHALGLGAFQVGRSHECDYPESVRNLPVCTHPTFAVDGSSATIDSLVKEKLSAAASIYRIDSDVVKQLRPTHVLTQTLCDVCAVSFADVQTAFQGEHGFAADIVPLSAGSLAGVWADVRHVAGVLGAAVAGETLLVSLQERMQVMAERASRSAVRPRMAAIEWIEPLMAAGNWVPELIELAATENLFGRAGEHSPWMDWDELRAADSDVIVALPCGFDLVRTREEMGALARLPDWTDLRAVRSGRVYICDGNQFMNRPGPRLVESLQIFGEILHPELFEPMLEGSGWQRY